MKKLDKIELYTKASRLEANAVPIKTVHFVYDYSLCKKVPNNINGGGKLTLKRVGFNLAAAKREAAIHTCLLTAKPIRIIIQKNLTAGEISLMPKAEMMD
jgi:hypothetical protein